jgi:hypothetical protein
LIGVAIGRCHKAPDARDSLVQGKRLESARHFIDSYRCALDQLLLIGAEWSWCHHDAVLISLDQYQ